MSMDLVSVSTDTLNKLLASRQNPQENLDAIIARHSASEPAASQAKVPAEKSETLTALPFGRYKVARPPWPLISAVCHLSSPFWRDPHRARLPPA